jgi:hypothetical protein
LLRIHESAKLAKGTEQCAPFVNSSKELVQAAPLGPIVEGEHAVKAGTEIVERAMSKAELKATKETGLLRGGREGTHYVSDAVNTSGNRARERLALPQKPEVKATLEVPAGKFSKPTKVKPDYGMPGGGTERKATGQIPAKVKKVEEFD